MLGPLPLVQVRYDLEYFFGGLLSACRNISNRLIVKYRSQNLFNGLLLWDEIVTQYSHFGSKELTIHQLEGQLMANPVDDKSSLLDFVEKYKICLHTLQNLASEDFSKNRWKSYFLRKMDVKSNNEIVYGTQKCRDSLNWDIWDSIDYIRKIAIENAWNNESTTKGE